MIAQARIILAAGCATSAWISAALAQTPSSFQLSCTNIVVHDTTLKADCRRVNGTLRETMISIRGIDSIDGTLTITGWGESTYPRACRDIGILGDELSALCKRRDGTFGMTSVRIPRIGNINGSLRYKK